VSDLQAAFDALDRVEFEADDIRDIVQTDIREVRMFLESLEEEWGIAHPSTLAKPQKVANRLTALARAEFLIRKKNLPRLPVVRYVSKWVRG
jgi:hypothetical protein